MELVTERKGKAITTSLKIADFFGKLHNNVLRDIKTIKNTLDIIGNTSINFEESSYTSSQNKKHPMYILNYDAFAILVFGFTGEKAMKLKADFIQAFHTLEQKLIEDKIKTEIINTQNIPQTLRQIADLTEKHLKETEKLLLTNNKVKTISVPRNRKTASVSYAFNKMGLKPIKTTDYLIDTGYLERVPTGYTHLNSIKTLKKPTKKGKPYFYAICNGLYIFAEGIDLIENKINMGQIPEKCFKKVKV